MPVTVVCPGAEDTYRLGRRIGAACRRGVLITLSGALGSGKTTLVQGLAAGLDVPARYRVTSPSYTLINEYPGRIGLAHADLYRLAGGASVEEIGLAELVGDAWVLAVEWPDRLPVEAFSDCLQIHLGVRGDEAREITLDADGPGARDVLADLFTNERRGA